MNCADLRVRLSCRIHENDILEILYHCQESKEFSDEIAACAFDEDTRVASNALWVLTWDRIERAVPLRDNLVLTALSTSHVTIRRLCLTLLERMEWGKADLRVDLLDFCLVKAIAESEPPGVRALCIKLGFSLCRHYTELVEELKMTLDTMAGRPLSPGVACARKNVLKKMEKIFA